MKKILVIGSLNMDYSIATNKLPLPGETVIGKSLTLNPGGKGANQAYAMGKLNARVTMMGMVGSDDNAKLLKENLNSVNVNTSGVKETNNNTGVAFVTVDSNGENSIIVISGANGDLTEDFIDENINLIDDSDIIVMQLEIPINVVSYVAKISKEKGKLVILDPAPAKYDLSDDLYKNIDIIKPNETELSTLTGIKIDSEDNLIDAARALLGKGVKNVIVTLGGKGSLLVNKDLVKRFNALDVEVVDTTAAGDSFTAALATYLSLGKNLEESIDFAHKVSAIVVTKYGAQVSIPTLDEVNEFLNNRR